MSAQVANTGIVGSTTRVMHPRMAVASASEFVDPMAGAFAPPSYGNPRYDDEADSFETPRRRRRYSPYQDQVVSFGGVLVSREVGATIMKEQAAQAARGGLAFGASDTERSVRIYEFNQSLMGVAEAVTDVGVTYAPAG
ncbi:MAG: hypothetical protein K1X51_12330 [Rhodospirillaceae bacterium]|nr:hypothetical protein [Rhodospirillaceae bacterium]